MNSSATTTPITKRSTSNENITQTAKGIIYNDIDEKAYTSTTGVGQLQRKVVKPVQQQRLKTVSLNT